MNIGVRAKRVAWMLWGVATLLVAVSFLFQFLNSSTAAPSSSGSFWLATIVPLSIATIGALVTSNRPENPIGWIFALIGALSALHGLTGGYAIFGLLARPGSVPASELIAWLYDWLWIPWVGTMLTVGTLLFPNGKLLSLRWRAAVWLSVAAMVVAAVVRSFLPGPLENFPTIDNPLGIDKLLGARQTIDILSTLPFLGAILLALVSLALRFRRSSGDERLQMKWFVAAASLAGFAIIVYGITEMNEDLVTPGLIKFREGLTVLGILAVPLAMGVAILKYRLYDIDLVINRTLVYGPLTAVLAGVYMAGIGIFKALFTNLTGETSDAAVAFTTLFVVALFTPVKNRFQSIVDRHFKETPDPAKDLKRLEQELRSVVDVFEASRITGRLLDEAIKAFDAEAGAVYLNINGQMVVACSRGEWNGHAEIRVPLEHDGRRFGELSLRTQNGTARYTAQDLAVLQSCANLVATALSFAETEKR